MIVVKPCFYCLQILKTRDSGAVRLSSIKILEILANAQRFCGPNTKISAEPFAPHHETHLHTNPTKIQAFSADYQLFHKYRKSENPALLARAPSGRGCRKMLTGQGLVRARTRERAPPHFSGQCIRARVRAAAHTRSTAHARTHALGRGPHHPQPSPRPPEGRARTNPTNHHSNIRLAFQTR
jgi:hypothetical protein